MASPRSAHGKLGTLHTLVPRYQRQLHLWANCLPWHVAIAQVAWERHRDVLAMRAIGMRYRAITEQTGLPYTATRMLLFRISTSPDGNLGISPVQRWLSHSGDLAEMAQKMRQQGDGRSYYGRRNVGAHRRARAPITREAAAPADQG